MKFVIRLDNDSDLFLKNFEDGGGFEFVNELKHATHFDNIKEMNDLKDKLDREDISYGIFPVEYKLGQRLREIKE